MIIYKTTNLINELIYIGKACGIRVSNGYLGSGHHVKRAIVKYGKQNFSRETIDICENRQDQNRKEIFWIDKLDARNPKVGYNISKGGEGGDNFTNNPSKEKIRKKMIAATRLAMKNPEVLAKLQGPKSEEHKISLSKAQKQVDRHGEKNPNYGGLSEQHCKNISKSRIEKGTAKGKNNPMYGRTGEKSPHFGKPKSEEHRRKISISNIGKNNGKKPSTRKLTDKQVIEIRKLKKDNHNLTYREISKNYGVTISAIHAVIKNKVYGELLDAS